MGADQTVTATVTELLPNATFAVVLDNQRRVIAHTAGETVRNFVRLRPGDRVEVELSPYDGTRGRILRMVEESRLD